MPLQSRSLALILLALPFFLNLGTSALWDANEAFYAETPREMVERGDYIYPTFNYEPRIHKPPLAYWLVAASYRLIGVSEFSARLPSAIGACALLGFLIYFLRLEEPSVGSPVRKGGVAGKQNYIGLRSEGPAPPVSLLRSSDGLVCSESPPLRTGLLNDASSRLKNDRAPEARDHGWTTAILAASILATTPRFLIVARRLPIDCFLTVFLTLGLLFVYWAFQSDETAKTASQRYWKWSAAGFFTGLAFLTKGPVTLMLLMMIAGIFAWIEGKRPSRGAALFFTAFFLTALPYYLLLYERGGSAAIYNFFVTENLGRYTIVDFSPSRAPSYFLEVLLADAFPWSWFLPAAVYLWKSWRSAHRSLLRFCWIWFATILIFFSFSHTKEEYYILPAYPALAILLSHFFGSLPQMSGKAQRVLTANGFAVAVGLAGMGVFALRLSRILLPGIVTWLVPLLFVLGSLVMVRLFWRGETLRAAGFLAMLLLLISINVAAIFLPVLETLRPTRQLTARAAAILGPEDHPGYFRFTSPSMCFYLRRHICELFGNGELESNLDKTGRSILLMEVTDYDQLPDRIRDRMEIVASAQRFPTRGKELLKIRSAADLPRVLLVAEKGK